MKAILKSNVFKNGIALGLQKGIRILDQLIMVPFFITNWGVAYYGEWITLTIIPSVLAFADLGFGTSVANTFVLKYLAGEKKEAADLKKTGLWIISLIIIAAFFLCIIVLLILKYFNVLENSLIPANQALIALFFIISSKLITFYHQLFESYFRAVRKAALCTHISNFFNIGSLLAGIAVLMLGYDIIVYAMVQLIFSIIYTVFYGWYGSTFLNELTSVKGEINKGYLKEIIVKGFAFLMSPVWQSIYFQGTTFVVRITLGPESVTLFNTVRTLSRTVNQLYSLINSSVFPELQYEIGTNNMHNAQKLYVRSIRIVIGLALLGVLLLWFAGPWFYNIWTRNLLVIPKDVWGVFVIGVLFNALWWTAVMVFRSFNQPQKIAIGGILSALFSVLLCYLLAPQLGLLGVALGYLSLDVIMVIVILPASLKMMHIKFADLYNRKLY